MASVGTLLALCHKDKATVQVKLKGKSFISLQARRRTVLQMEILEVNIKRHAVWNRNPINTVHVVWIVAWISRTFQNVVDNRTTHCKSKEKT